MSARAEATTDDLYRLAGKGKAELVNGEVVLIPPSAGLHGFARVEIMASLREFTRTTKSGHALAGNVAYVVDLPHRKSFCPDVAFHIGPMTMKFVSGAPVFAVEVRREDDHGPAAELRFAAKRRGYFAAGSLVVWDVDLQGADPIRSYRADQPDHPLVFRRGESAHAEPAVPGWSMPVDDLWP